MKYIWQQSYKDGAAKEYIIELNEFDSNLELVKYDGNNRRYVKRCAKRNAAEDSERISEDELAKFIHSAQD